MVPSWKGQQILLYSTAFRGSLGPIQPPVQRLGLLGAVAPGVKRLRREADYSLPSSVEVKNDALYEYTHAPNRSSRLGIYLIKHKDNFTSIYVPNRPPLSSSGEFLATNPEVRIRFPACPDFLSSWCGTGSTQPPEYNSGAIWKKK
jgi:hypothetical protein